ncbi:hypothetical protein JK386_03535 [Nocardioides sp. zg-536]|uniref:Uncharacterized protein n=1 Tax=Nocardioides faecalis TaxID=2803858 RepID=A0A938Y4D3_9ACTN|nr:hypothetical protein [Nocardioides faecalis]MBM9458962.1 hypothetical protein [Nocardioides faecalis]MBS4753936.1 hypothetical protein [Nocardioides faecalis]QVI60357.1 hypothetical protein KG111_08795 [Nocardioides faecalis]
MTVWLLTLVLVLAAAVAVLLVVDLVRDRAAQDSHFIALAVLEVVMIAQLVGGSIAVARTDREIEGAVLISYLVTVVLAPVVAAFFALSERSRVGTTILLLGVATVAGLEVRVWDLWNARA